MTVNHKDGIKTNNYVSNLEIMTYGQNEQHAYDMGLRVGPLGERQGIHKLTWESVRSIRAMYQPGVMSYRSIADIYGVDTKTVWHVVKHNSWKE